MAPLLIKPDIRRTLKYLMENRDKPRYVTEIAQDIGLNSGAVTVIMRELHDRGWTVRRTHQGDGTVHAHRRLYYKLSEDGIARAEKLFAEG